MRIILILWAIPIILFWGWYALSVNDMHFGNLFLSRLFHDHMFQIYGNMLNMPPEEVPAKIAGVFIFDTGLLFSIAAFRWRKSWLPGTLAWFRDVSGWDVEHGSTTEPLIDGFFYGDQSPIGNSVGQARPAE